MEPVPSWGTIPRMLRDQAARHPDVPVVESASMAALLAAARGVARGLLALGVRPGDRVLDLCAGPGGKSTHLAALTGPAGSVVAVELHPHRAELIRQAAARVGVSVDVRVGDAADAPVAADEQFDVVLLDAPCTGLGTGRRRPEVRWRRTPDDTADLADLQRSLLAAAASHLAPGGRLTYSVCTWTAAETDAVADTLQRDGLTPGERRQLLPDRDDTDGMFIATWWADHPGSGGAGR